MLIKIGHKVVTRDAPQEGAQGGSGQSANPVAPWGSDAVWNIGDGDTAKPWYGVIPEPEARSHVEAKGYKNPAELALANYNLTKLQRGDPTVIGLPGEAATPEDWNAFYGKLGRPEAPTGYEFKFADGVTADPKMVTFAQTAFHEAGLTPKQAQLVAEKWNAFVAETGNGSAEQNDKDLAALATKWGAELDKNKTAGQRVVNALGLSTDLIARVEAQIGSAAIVELLATIGRKSDEGVFINSNGGGDANNPETMTKEQATARKVQLDADPEFQKRYLDAKHPGHSEAVQTMVKLYARL